jgi:aspartyl-tRNA synthetase
MKRRGAGTLSVGDAGQRVLLQGWVHQRRDHAGVTFLNLRDRSGVVQAVLRAGDEAAQSLEPARLEWVVELEGTVARRAPEAVNPEMATGEVEVLVERGAVLSRAEPLPFAIAEEVDASEDTRLRYRYLDLRRPSLQRNLELRHRATLEALQYFHEQGFLHVETPILTRSTPEGARDYLVPSRVHRGRYYALPQSPQLFKQLCMVAGLERYVQIARCFRDEDLRADRQPEFTQIDVEMSFPDEEQIFEVVEGLLARLFALAEVAVPRPFPRLTWAEAVRRFGTDRPDLRFGAEIVDLTTVLGRSGFRGFRAAAEAGGVVRGLALPGAAGASRRQLEEWAAVARQHGAPGALAARRADGRTTFQVKDALTEGELGELAGALGLEEGGLALLAAGPERSTAAALGAVRVEAARACGLVPAGRHAFLWVTEFPLVEWDGTRWQAVNHPFTSPDPRDLERWESAPGTMRARAYDVVLDGFELGGGSIRIHDAALQQRAFDLLGIAPAEARERFGFLLDALRFGAPPHGGIALGLDRIVMLMAGAASLRDVIAFPKTTSASCLMTDAPGPVDARQLAELGLADLER